MKNRIETNHLQQQKSNNTDPGNLLLILYIFVVILFLIIGTLSQASAGIDGEFSDVVELNDIQDGELLIADENTGKYTAAPLLSQNVELSITGMVVNALVTQRFKNVSNEWIEAVYAFPLPAESAVKHLRMVIGEKVIVGEIQEKQKAAETYEKAKSEGKKTSLLAQKRPNIFTMAVANIPPMGTVEVQIEYIDMVRYDDAVFSIRFPMVIGPRYIPGNPRVQQKRITFDKGGWAADTDQVPDASEITPPVTAADEPAINPVELTISLEPGFPVLGLNSLYHGMDIGELDKGRYLMAFNGQVFSDRDFVLEYKAANENEAAAALFSQEKKGENYHLLMLVPPVLKTDYHVPREVILVLDISGSMAGSSIRQAKSAMQYAVSRLNGRDHFNVVVFNSSASAFFSSSLSATQENKDKARKKIGQLTADGGTEIAPALKLALDGREDHQRIRQVIFLTDGAVGNERALFQLISSRLGDSRLFTIGIGSAPNSYFMTRAAAMGRGSFSYIGDVSEVSSKMTALFEKLENPVISGVTIASIGGRKLEMYPDPMPDLYYGEPITALIKSDGAVGALSLSGITMGRSWNILLDAATGQERSGISTLWARRKIKSLMGALNTGAAEEEVRSQILQTALAHNLVSKYTSLVAVEKEVSRPVADKIDQQQIKTNLPQGWQHQKVFGTSAKTATNSHMLMLAGLILFFLSLILLRKKRVIV